MESEISIGKWKKHFMEDGSEIGQEKERAEDIGTGQKEEELKEEEIRKAIRNMKLNKSAGIDGVPMRHAGEL